MTLFNQEQILVSTEVFFTLYRGIVEASSDPGFGLKLGTEERFERYEPIKIAALSERSFRDAVKRLSRYKQLTCPEEMRMDSCHRAPEAENGPESEGGLSFNEPSTSRTVRGSFPLPREIQIQSERLDIE